MYTFCNSILGANEKSKEIFDGESISEIYVIHSPESFNELFVKNNDEILDSIMDAEGITFNTKDKKTGPYSLEMPFRN